VITGFFVLNGPRWFSNIQRFYEYRFRRQCHARIRRTEVGIAVSQRQDDAEALPPLGRQFLRARDVDELRLGCDHPQGPACLIHSQKQFGTQSASRTSRCLRTVFCVNPMLMCSHNGRTDQDVFDCRFARNCMRDPLLAQKTKSIHISASVNRG
jgi:hypothetical protein